MIEAFGFYLELHLNKVSNFNKYSLIWLGETRGELRVSHRITKFHSHGLSGNFEVDIGPLEVES